MILSYHAVPTEEEMFFISRPLRRLFSLLLHGPQKVLPHFVHGVTHLLHGAAHAGFHGLAAGRDRHADRRAKHQPGAHTAPKNGRIHISHTPFRTTVVYPRGRKKVGMRVAKFGRRRYNKV